MSLSNSERFEREETRHLLKSVGGLLAFVGLGQFVEPASGPIGTAVAVGAVGCLALSLVYSFQAMGAQVEREQLLEERVDELEEATDDDVREAIGGGDE